MTALVGSRPAEAVSAREGCVRLSRALLVVAGASVCSFAFGQVLTEFPLPTTKPKGSFISPLPVALEMDSHPSGSASNVNGVMDPGESVLVEPTYTNANVFTDVNFSATASNFAGPVGANYSIPDSSASYAIPAASVGTCVECYVMSVDDPAARPAAHWDATFDESFLGICVTTWGVHIGESFADVAVDDIFYAFIENLFHNGITAGCGAGNYCPGNAVTRAQMAVLLLRAKHGAAYEPPPCQSLFADVTCPGPFANWIEQLAVEEITAGCGSGDYCPNTAVDRRQAAVLLLKTKEGPEYLPPPATGIFVDVPQSDVFAPWIEELHTRGVTAGCGVSPLLYCPGDPSPRGQVAALIVRTFGSKPYKVVSYSCP